MEPNGERYLGGTLTLSETMHNVPSACAYSIVDESQKGLALASEVLEMFPINSFFCGSSVCLRGQELARAPSGPFHFVQVFIGVILHFPPNFTHFVSKTRLFSLNSNQAASNGAVTPAGKSSAHVRAQRSNFCLT